MASVAQVLQPVEADLEVLLGNLRDLIGAGHPILQAAAEHLFRAGGKKLRPALVLMLARAIDPGEPMDQRQRRLAEITEMIHTASLVHDDLVDEASTRRGVATVHHMFDPRMAVLAGDFLFAQASWHLANLGSLEVVRLLSRVIMDLAEGEVCQRLNRYDSGQTLEDYLEKSYRKTASLMANSARAVGVLAGLPEPRLESLYRFGRQLGMIFQVVDDCLDFTASDQQLGKPAASDLRAGYLTAPAIFALEEEAGLAERVERRFTAPGDLEAALTAVRQGSGLERTHAMAHGFARDAEAALAWLPPSQEREALLGLPEVVLRRLN